MTTAQDKIPALPGELDSLFRPAKQEPPKPAKRKLVWWHVAIYVVGVPILAFLSCVGANTVVHWWIKDRPAAQTAATGKPTPHKPAGPRYNLAGYHSAITGPEEQAFASALWKLRADIRRPDYTAAATDAPRLMAAAGSWLSLLRPTNPPPSYGPQKLTYLQAAAMARRAGGTIQQALNTENLQLLQRGADQAARARFLLSHAAAQAPHGS
jgi:hypothetical protein